MEVDYRTLRKVVSRVGLEPTTRCLRGSCSTIELPAHVNLEIVTRDFSRPTRNDAPGLRMLAQSGCNFLSNLARANQISRSQRNRRDPRVSAATMFFAQRREVYILGRFFPGISAHR